MSKILVRQAHNKSVDEARAAIRDFEQQIAKYGLKANWKGNSATLKGIGASGRIDITSSDVAIEVKLGMMAKAAGIDADRLETSIKKRLVAAFED